MSERESMRACMHVCVCNMRERDRDREREGVKKKKNSISGRQRMEVGCIQSIKSKVL